MHWVDDMLNSVKNLVDTVGDNAGDFAKRFGPLARDAARRVGPAIADAGKAVGSNTAQLARRVGPKRALLGIALLGVAVGSTIYVVRYLRARAEDVEDGEQANASPPAHGVRRGGSKRKENRAQPPVH